MSVARGLISSAFLLLSILSSDANASISGIQSFSGGTQNAVIGRTNGYQFQAQQDFSVDALLWFDWGSNGLQFSRQVGLWTDSGTLLGSVVVNSGTSSSFFGQPQTQGQYRGELLATPIALTSGAIYRVGGVETGGEDRGVFQPTSIVTSSEITHLGTVADFNPGPPTFEFPGDFTPGQTSGYVGGADLHIAHDNGAIPEPTSLIVWGLLGAVCLKRRRR